MTAFTAVCHPNYQNLQKVRYDIVIFNGNVLGHASRRVPMERGWIALYLYIGHMQIFNSIDFRTMGLWKWITFILIHTVMEARVCRTCHKSIHSAHAQSWAKSPSMTEHRICGSENLVLHLTSEVAGDVFTGEALSLGNLELDVGTVTWLLSFKTMLQWRLRAPDARYPRWTNQKTGSRHKHCDVIASSTWSAYM